MYIVRTNTRLKPFLYVQRDLASNMDIVRIDSETLDTEMSESLMKHETFGGF